MFRELLSTTEKRQLELLEHLSDEKGCTMEELSFNLGCTIRTIRNDIEYFRRRYRHSFTVYLTESNRWFIKENYPLSILKGMNDMYKENINV